MPDWTEKDMADLINGPQTNEFKYKVLQSKFNDKYLYSKLYNNLLVLLIRINANRDFVLYLKERDVFIQSDDAEIDALKSPHIDFIKFLIENDILRITEIHLKFLLQSLELTKFIYEGNYAKLNECYNYYNVLFDDECKNFDEIFAWLQLCNYKSDRELHPQILTVELIKFAMAQNWTINTYAIKRISWRDPTIFDKLEECGYKFDKKRILNDFNSLTLEEKREFILNNWITVDIAMQSMLKHNDVETFKVLYAEFRPRFEMYRNFMHSILMHSRIEFMRIVVAASGKKFIYGEDRFGYAIFGEKTHNFDLWKQMHDEDLIEWSESEVFDAMAAPDYQFARFACKHSSF